MLLGWGVAATVDGLAGASRVKGSLRRFAPLTRSFPAVLRGYRGDARGVLSRREVVFFRRAVVFLPVPVTGVREVF
jgi:hypothetical protein